MKVLQIINSLATGGAEKLILDTIPLLNEKGIHTDVAVFKSNEYPFQISLKQKNCCYIHNLNFNSVYNPFIIFKLRNIIKNYDVVHVHLFPALYFTLLASLFLKKKPKLVYTEHSTHNKRQKHPIFKPLDRFIYKNYSKIIAISKEIKKIIQIHAHLPNEKLIVIENGVDLNLIFKANAYRKTELNSTFSESDKIIIQVSSFNPVKDQVTLIKSMIHLPQEYKLLLVGDGVNKERCIQLSKDLHLDKRILFLGVRSDIPQLLKSADYVVLSSQYEGLSLSSIEGMASGKPFIASNVPGLRTVVDGAGILFEYKNSKALADVILKLDKNLKFKSQVIENCIQRAKQYDIINMIDKLMHTYQSM
ncbi:glycosyltransferase [Weeksellaceae bacterium KMM 9713]|uniref:Glycosyltransferase n=1 Tax=Profundicola chukchiensis TaxID=2961959 RepID=A0A9X4RVL0_9FLAO|nr:glycosyltransferase [Profundicola chukchiensis]MDG4944802.1 glycosyltransferase [Profundicola chukchiensis]